MERKDLTTVKQIFSDPEKYAGQKLHVAGWARKLRASNAFGFIELNDGTYFTNLQVVFESSVLGNYDEIAHQNIGCALHVRGELVMTPDAKQPFEIHASERPNSCSSLTILLIRSTSWLPRARLCRIVLAIR